MKTILLALICVFSLAANAAECIGHIFFYNLEEGKGEVDTDSDYAFYYHKTISWLPNEGVSYSTHTELPINNKTCFSSEVKILQDQLEYSLGYVFIKPNLDKKVIGGVLTDMDISSVINEFFK
jgi:hypothetical protein